MPANKKYLLRSGWAKSSKVLAALFGSLIASLALLTLVAMLGYADLVLLSSWFTFPSLWVAFIVVVYWVKSPMKAWGLLLSISLVCGVIIYFLKMSA